MVGEDDFEEVFVVGVAVGGVGLGLFGGVLAEGLVFEWGFVLCCCCHFCIIGKEIGICSRGCMGTYVCPAASLLLALTGNHVTILGSCACILVIDPCSMILVNWIEVILGATRHLIPRKV